MQFGTTWEPDSRREILAPIERLRELCRVPADETERQRFARLSAQISEFMELFSLPFAKSEEGMMAIFRLVDNPDSKQLFAAMREYLRLELLRLEDAMNEHLQKADDFNPILLKEMDLIARSELMLSRPSSMRVMTQDEIKESLKRVYVLPKSHLKGGRGYRNVDNEIGYFFYPISQPHGEEGVRHGS